MYNLVVVQGWESDDQVVALSFPSQFFVSSQRAYAPRRFPRAQAYCHILGRHDSLHWALHLARVVEKVDEPLSRVFSLSQSDLDR